MDDKLRVGVSTCLLGENVRYDGGHQLDRFVRDELGPYVEFVPVCPEVECGLPTPREALRLVGPVDAPRLITRTTLVDHTQRMLAWAAGRLDALAAGGLCGFIFKSDSPSSGMERVRVYPSEEGGMASKKGVGIWARAFMERFPSLPVEEDGRLHDANLRENFIERIFVVKRWHDFLAAGPTRGALVEFHTRHKLMVMAHSVTAYHELGRLVAGPKGVPLAKLLDEYFPKLMAALTERATVRATTNVLQHVSGYFKKQLTADEKQEAQELITRYRLGQVPLVVPVTLLNHYVRKFAEPYLAGQLFLNPHPAELKLRNHC